VTLASTAIWTRNVGVAEDWRMVPPWLGYEPDLLGWLWAQNNEHRLPLQRLIYLGLLKASDDFRSGMILSQLLMAALSLILARAAASARGGRHRLVDVVYPLALLHLGHWENLLWSWQFQFVWSVFLGGLVLAVLIARPLPSFRDSLVVAAALVLLPLSGANGIATATAMFPWAIAVAFLQRRGSGGDARVAVVLIAGIALSAAAAGAYFIGYESPPWSPPLATPAQFIVAAKAYFAMATGVWFRALPFGSRGAELAAAAGVVAVSCVGGLLALWGFVRRWRTDGARGLGLALFIGSGLALGVLIAAGRGAYPYQMPARYALFSAMPLLAALAAWEFYAPRLPARTIGALAALGFLLLLPLNAKAGFTWRDWYLDGVRQVEADIAERRPPAAIASRHFPFLMHWCESCLAEAIARLRDAGIGPFARLREPR
jgi:hypothetical protein